MMQQQIKSIQNKKAFTLVELIIVITILSILSVIAFISFQGYSGTARDGNKLTTLSTIEKGLSLYKIKTGKYPQPDNIYGTGTYAGTILMNVGYIGADISRAINLNKEPKDPFIEHNYTYGITHEGKYYQLATALENNQTAFIPTTYAKNYTSKVVGDYKGLYKFSAQNKNYIINLPSLLFTEPGEYNFQAGVPIENPKFVINKGDNLVKPYDENNNQGMNATLVQLTGTGVSLTGVTIPETKEEWENKKQEFENIFGYEPEIIGKEIFGEKEYVNLVKNTETSDSGDGESSEPEIPEPQIPPTPESCFETQGGTITKYLCEDKQVVLPNQIGGVDITAVGNYVFQNKGLTELVLSNTITYMGYGAFASNNLVSLNIPAQLTSITQSAFSSNKIETLTFATGAKVASIGHSAFSYNKIQHLVLPDSIKKIEYGAFQSNALQTIVISKNITEIKSSAFSYNSNLSEVTNYDGEVSQEYIYTPFENGILLAEYFGSSKDVEIPSQIYAKSVVAIGSYAFNGYDTTSKITTVVLPNTITTILDGAFASNSITTINIPSSVTNIGSSAFGMNRGSNGADMSLASVTNYDGVVSSEYIYFPINNGTEMEILEYFGTNRNVVIPNTINGLPVTRIGDFAFYRPGSYWNNNLLTLQLPNALKTIGNQTFDGNALEEIIFPASMTYIGTSSFRYNKLKTIRFLGASVGISSWAFDYQNDSSGDGTIYGAEAIKNAYYSSDYFDMSKFPNFVVQ